MRNVGFGVAIAAGLTLASSSPAEAQEAGWWDWALAELLESRSGDRDERSADDRYERRRGRPGDLPDGLTEIVLGQRGADRFDHRDRGDRRAGRGPPFCSNGRGHPVHGRSWCRKKGWGVDTRSPVRWERVAGRDDVILRSLSGPRGGGVIDRGGLMDILGDVILARLSREAHLRRAGDISGRWLRPRGHARVLQIRSGSIPVAELTDADDDGRVDAVLVPRR